MVNDFFVSYNRADREWAEWIAWQLEDAGHKAVLQAWDFTPGSNFVLEMDRASRKASRTIAVLSPDYLRSLYTQPEWAAAFAVDPTGVQKKLLPVLVRPCDLRGLLAQIVHVDLVGLDRPSARERLLAGISGDRIKPRHEPRFPRAAIFDADRAHYVQTLETISDDVRVVEPDTRAREDIARVLSVLRSKNALYADLDHEIWEYVFKSLRALRDILAETSGQLHVQGPRTIKALVDFMADAVRSYIATYEAAYTRFMQSEYQHLGVPHRERNWPEVGLAERGLLRLRTVLHLSIEHLNQYASDGVTVSWPTVISHVQENDLNLDPPTTPETAVLLPKTDRMSATMLAMPFLTTKTAVWSSRRMYSYVHVASYGEGDRDVLLFPTDKGSYEEYEQGGLFSLISDVLRERIRLYSFRAQYAWLENVNYAGAKALDEWDDVLMKEILPLIRRERGTNAMPLTCGVGDAAFLAANALFRHPDSFAGLIGVNGLYGAQAVTRRSRAELYFHDPVAFLSKLTGHEHHLLLQDGKHIALLAGQGVPAAVDSTHDLTNVLRALNVRVTTDLWGADVDDSWPWRAKLLAHALSAL